MSFALLVALASMIVVLAAVGIREGHAANHDAHSTATPATSAKAMAFHDAMRALWEAHGAWTHMVIVSSAGNLANLAAEEQVLLQNQVDIGNAVKPYHGVAAGHELTKLLKAHILDAVNVLGAAKSGDRTKLSRAQADWFANRRQVADLLHAADPRFLSRAAADPRLLSRAAARRMMTIHLSQVIQQGVDELTGHYAADARAFAPYTRHILDMADMISNGIIQQFPSRFH